MYFELKSREGALMRFAKISLALIAMMAAAPSFGVTVDDGGIFKIEATGFESCGDFARQRISKRNNVDLWMRVDNVNQLTLSFTPTFDEDKTFPMFGRSYIRNRNFADFVGAVYFEDGSWAAISGAAQLNKKTGLVIRLAGRYVQDGVLFSECFSSGKFKSGKRLN